MRNDPNRNPNPARAWMRGDCGSFLEGSRAQSGPAYFFAAQTRNATAAAAPRRCQTEGRYGVRRMLMNTVAPASKAIDMTYPRRDVSGCPRVRGQIHSTRKIGIAMLTTAG